MTNYTVLIANGEFPNNEYCNDILSNNPEIICVDTDQKLIEKLDIQPKIILGDLDTAKINKVHNNTRVIQLDNQNKTDIVVINAIDRSTYDFRNSWRENF